MLTVSINTVAVCRRLDPVVCVVVQNHCIRIVIESDAVVSYSRLVVVDGVVVGTRINTCADDIIVVESDDGTTTTGDVVATADLLMILFDS